MMKLRLSLFPQLLIFHHPKWLKCIQWGTDKSTPGFKGKEPNIYHGRMFETDFGRHKIRIEQYWWTTFKGNKNKRTEGSTFEVCLWVSNDRVFFQQKRLLGHTFLLWPAVHLSYPRNTHFWLSLVSHRALVHKPESEALETCWAGTEICLWLLFFRGDDTYLSFKGIKLQKGGATHPPHHPNSDISWQGSNWRQSGKGCDHKWGGKSRKVQKTNSVPHTSLSDSSF